MKITFDTKDIESYRKFIAVKGLPFYRIRGSVAWFPDEYADIVGVRSERTPQNNGYVPKDFLFDYQKDISAMAIKKRKFAVFADCGLGKSLIEFEFARHAIKSIGDKNCVLVTPLMVVPQMVNEYERFYGETIDIVRSSDLDSWLRGSSGKIGITNWEAFKKDVKGDKVGCLVLDESSILKSQYGKYGQAVLEIGKGVEWKMAATGTPAPNDRIEYANHAVFLDVFPTVNSFLSTYFVNKGKTQNRWEIRPHALKPFYLALSHWSIFLTNPATYGWKDNCESIPPIKTHIHDVDITEDQRRLIQSITGQMFVNELGGVKHRAKFGQIAKGRYNGERVETNKPDFIRRLVDSWPGESTIIWCIYNEEQEDMRQMFPQAECITGSTKYERRIEMIDRFKSGESKILISKPKILGFGLNLQVATRQVFSGLQDSFESFYQAVKRSNRYGSTRPLNVHIPVTEIERPMVDNVLRKAHRVQSDTDHQEKIFQQTSKEAVQWTS